MSREYVKYTGVFLPDLAMKLPDKTRSNRHATKGKQTLYGLIYNLSLVKLEISKTFIKTYPKPGFVRPL